MAKTLEAHDKLIREIFEGSYQFEIPDYQRPYAWTIEQATELFDDLYSAMQDARISGASSQYFLGSIVLIKNDRDPKSSVVDGQQRLGAGHQFGGVRRPTVLGVFIAHRSGPPRGFGIGVGRDRDACRPASGFSGAPRHA